MQSIYMTNHFKNIYEQREKFANEIKCFKNKEWKRPYKDKWSFGETYYHLYLMVRRFRQLNKYYLPLSIPIAMARKESSYKIHSKNIYTEYKEKRNKVTKWNVNTKLNKYFKEFQFVFHRCKNPSSNFHWTGF